MTGTPLWLTSPAAFAVELSRPRLQSGDQGPPLWTPARHLQAVSLALADCAAGRTTRLAIFAPPRHGKTELVSRWFVLWWLALRPADRVILAAHTATYAQTHGVWVRDRLDEHAARIGVGLREGWGTTAEAWNTDKGGGMLSAGVGGPITGRGANLFVIDDPIKSQAEADSPTYRRRTIEWWEGTSRTRLEPGGVVVFIMTRWHADDLGGWLLANHRERWRVLRLPAVADGLDIDGREPARDAIGRAEGEALWPERWSLPALEETRDEVGVYVFGAQYQGLPPERAGGGMLPRDRQALAIAAYREAFPDGIDADRDLRRIVVGVDPPGGRTDCGIVVVGELTERAGDGRPRAVILEDATVGRRPSPETWAQAVIDAYQRWGANEVVAERNYGGDMVSATIRAIDPTVPVVDVNASKGKRVRAEPVAALYPSEGRPGRIMRAGDMPLLSSEWATWQADSGMESPNRVDAEVWAITRLGLSRGVVRRARGPL